MVKKRIVWVDNVKIIAIILVVLGHLMQSFVKSGIIALSSSYDCFIELIYCFHVPLFFICSGFLYQQYTKTDTLKSYSKNILKKFIALGVPYFVFSTITYLIKMFLEDSVNSQNETSLLGTLFVSPSAPYWFLYALFMFFIINPVIKKKSDAIIRLSVCAVLFVVFNFMPYINIPFLLTLVSYVFHHMIWFVAGMAVSYLDLTKKFKKYQGIYFIAFLILGIIIYYFSDYFIHYKLLLGVLACAGIIGFIGSVSNKNEQGKTLKFLSKYTMPVFLMHTLAAAGIRVILLKLGIENAAIHIVLGGIGTFILPVIAAMIMEKIKLDILYNPTKYIKIK